MMHHFIRICEPWFVEMLKNFSTFQISNRMKYQYLNLMPMKFYLNLQFDYTGSLPFGRGEYTSETVVS
jgi:hypothetical protein